jgi:hypothetical protein
MSPTEAEAFEARRRARESWPLHRHLLREEAADVLPVEIEGAERLAMAWHLSVEAWSLSGREWPRYERGQTPARLFRPGERRTDEE